MVNTKDGKLFLKRKIMKFKFSDENLNLIKIFELIQRRIQLKHPWENANMKVKYWRDEQKLLVLGGKDVDFKKQ